MTDDSGSSGPTITRKDLFDVDRRTLLRAGLGTSLSRLSSLSPLAAGTQQMVAAAEASARAAVPALGALGSFTDMMKAAAAALHASNQINHQVFDRMVGNFPAYARDASIAPGEIRLPGIGITSQAAADAEFINHVQIRMHALKSLLDHEIIQRSYFQRLFEGDGQNLGLPLDDRMAVANHLSAARKYAKQLDLKISDNALRSALGNLTRLTHDPAELETLRGFVADGEDTPLPKLLPKLMDFVLGEISNGSFYETNMPKVYSNLINEWMMYLRHSNSGTFVSKEAFESVKPALDAAFQGKFPQFNSYELFRARYDPAVRPIRPNEKAAPSLQEALNEAGVHIERVGREDAAKGEIMYGRHEDHYISATAEGQNLAGIFDLIGRHLAKLDPEQLKESLAITASPDFSEIHIYDAPASLSELLSNAIGEKQRGDTMPPRPL